MYVKVLSWNIWQGYHLDKIIDFLQENSAEIVALQEVIEKDNSNTAQLIADKLGYECAYYCAIDKTRLGFPQGNAILSKFTIESSKGHFLSDASLYADTAETEPRIAVETKISVNNIQLHVFTAHLAYSHMFQNSKFRDMQVENLINLLPSDKTIVLGDFNSHPDSSYMAHLNSVLNNADPGMKDPTWTMYPFDYEGFKETKLKHRLDYIFTSKDLSAKNFAVGKSMGSDHLPVLASINI